MGMNPALPVAITMGDAAGIAPEIIVKLFAQGVPAPAVVFGDAGILQREVNRLGLTQQLMAGAATGFASGTNQRTGRACGL